jgi:segregation and condensation protein A
MVALVDQYLAHVAQARRMRLELAADYLVMAAWLAYLKSRLLLPEPPAGEEPSGQEMADALQWQLRRLEAMQEAGCRLMARRSSARTSSRAASPKGVVVVRRAVWDVKLYDLLQAYGHQVGPRTPTPIRLRRCSSSRSRRRPSGWAACSASRSTGRPWKPSCRRPDRSGRRRSAIAATFVAGLQLAKDGQIELRQTERFGPIHLRKRSEPR